MSNTPDYSWVINNQMLLGLVKKSCSQYHRYLDTYCPKANQMRLLLPDRPTLLQANSTHISEQKTRGNWTDWKIGISVTYLFAANIQIHHSNQISQARHSRLCDKFEKNNCPGTCYLWIIWHLRMFNRKL